MPFNIDGLTQFCLDEITRFSTKHRSETFYAFAVDANLLCLNSEERARKTLRKYQEVWKRKHKTIQKLTDIDPEDMEDTTSLLKLRESTGLDLNDENACVAAINEVREFSRQEGNRYLSSEGIQSLRMNTGDWAYCGFAEMTPSYGFDQAAYELHYSMDADAQKNSQYALSMDALLARLAERNAFDCLQRSPDFRIMRVEHE